MERPRLRSPKCLLGALLLLLLLAVMMPLSAFLAGILAGGGGQPAPGGAERAAADDGTLEVTVVRAEDRAPVEGARILVEGLDGGGADRRSDASGRAVLGGLGRGPVRIEAVADGRKAVAWTDPSLGERLELAVKPETPRQGTVHGADGSPAAGAEVRLLDARGEVLETARADESGRYALPDLPEAVAVCARGDEGPPVSVARGDVDLEEGALVEGRLTGAGEGTLEVYGRVTDRRDDGVLPLRAAWTVAEDGTFSGRLPAGAEAWGVVDGVPVRVAPGAQALPERAHVVGTVSREDGSPAARAVLLFRPLLDGDFPAPVPPIRVAADEQGHFEATRTPALRYAVEASAPGCATEVFPDVRAGPEPLTFELAPGFDLQGTVLDTNGLPIPGATVRAAGFPNGSGEHPVAAARADARGRFWVRGLPGTRARVRIEAPHFYATSLEQVRPAATLRVILQRR